MRPLVLYCRWQQARLRLRGRDEDAVWGELAYNDERAPCPFRYELASRRLWLHPEQGRLPLQLDEVGVVVQA